MRNLLKNFENKTIDYNKLISMVLKNIMIVIIMKKIYVIILLK